MYSTVSFPEGTVDEAVQVLNDRLIPTIKGLPGFVDGTWFGRSDAGHGVMVFDTEEHAKAVADNVRLPDEGPARLETMDIYEVHGRA